MAKRKPLLTRIQRLLRADGALCVTFVNSQQRQALESYDHLLAWGLETGALEASDAQRLATLAAEHPGQAAGASRRAQTLRARLERVLLALVAGDSPSVRDLQPFNQQLRQAMAVRQLDPTGRQWIWGATDSDDLDRMLWPVLLSAANLLTSEDRHRLRQCPGEACGLLFIARNPGQPRKWCSQKCGNRSSSVKHYQQRLKPKRQAWAREKAGAQRARLAGYGPSWQPPGDDS